MTDSDINKLIVAQLDARMPVEAGLSGLVGLTVAQNFQPRQQGQDDGPCIYFVKLFDKRVGSVGTKDTFVAPVDPDPVGTMRHTEVQVYETHYQFMALLPQNPADVDRLTESDALNLVAGIIASDACRAALQAAGLGILRVMDVQNPYFQDDKDRFAASPSFDVVFTHKREREDVVPVLVTYDANVSRV